LTFSSNKTVFPDWGTQAGRDVWQQGLLDLDAKVSFDGIQLIGNEPATLCDGGADNNGTCKSHALSSSSAFLLEHKNASNKSNSTNTTINTNWYLKYGDAEMKDESTYFLPFTPQNYTLDNNTLALNASGHFWNTSGENATRKLYDAHSLYGHEQSILTSNVLTNISKNVNGTTLNKTRPFVVSASTFAGTGRHAYHTVTRNNRTWQDMRNSIASIMNFNMYGMPMTGADVCGHYALPSSAATNKDQAEICEEWLKLAAFQPFARLNFGNETYENDYNTTMIILQNHNLTETLSRTVHDRYRFLSLVYGCLFEASESGETCFDPLFYHYHGDFVGDQPFTDIEQNIIVGNAVKIAPALKYARDGKTEAFFPKGRWVNLNGSLSDVVVVTDPKG